MIPSLIEASAERPVLLRIAAAAPVEIQAAAASAEGSAPARPTFDILGYTGAPMRLPNFVHPVIADLAGLRARSQEIPAFRDHDANRIVGQTSSVSVDVKAGARFRGSITGDNADAAEVVGQSKNGFKWRASMGAGVIRAEFLKPGERATVNSRDVAGPLFIAREAVLEEISFVAVGADRDTTASVAASFNNEAGINVFDEWLKARGFDPAAINDTQKTSLRALFDTEQRGTAGSQSGQGDARNLDELMAGRRREDDRQAAITRITATALADRPDLTNEIEAMARSAIAGHHTPQQYELDVLRASRHRVNGFGRSDSGRVDAQVVIAAICKSGGLVDVEDQFDERTLEAADRRFGHGLGLKDLLVMAARANGYTGPTSSDINAIFEYAFIRAADGFSTMSLPGIMSNSANKFLRSGFMAVEDTWRKVCSTRSVRDFKTVTSYSLTGDLKYEKVGPAGELKHGAPLGELSYTNKAESYGRVFGVTRQDIINDDLGALSDVPKRLGRAGALKINEIFWTKFLSGVGSYWTAGRKNLITGGGSALASAGLTAAVTAFRKQVDADGQPVAITPKILLVPVDLEVTADELMTSTAVNTGGAATDAKVPNRNVWAQKFAVASSAYLSNAAFTNYSAAAWYLLADPQDLSTIEVCFLNGKDTPTIESANAQIGTLGVLFQAYHDFGVELVEYRASVRAAGS